MLSSWYARASAWHRVGLQCPPGTSILPVRTTSLVGIVTCKQVQNILFVRFNNKPHHKYRSGRDFPNEIMSKQGLEGNRFPDGDKRTEESITERHSRRRNSIYKSRVPGQRVTYSGNQRWTFFFTARENMRERWNMYFAKVIKCQGYFLRCSLNCLWEMKKVLVSLCR